ncbi:hypothetical protein AK88_01885 [Plasmodium fragile]|uniref:Uncharacterized protein n=1 Tax=Plasmodium fragile TaxID=5857 RepID=A0A0D9QNC2_PLAFR|nr:uncharacterized protein AK88_01885 [Plasmodium fragile]KJP88433.1 hypothetical protein AK88_01885 [Plasmodium fragile]
MLCLDKEDEIKFSKKVYSPRNNQERSKSPISGGAADKRVHLRNVQHGQHGYHGQNGPSDPSGLSGPNSKLLAGSAPSNSTNETFTDEVIYINTSSCNSFVYIITKICLYVFDNYDFSFVTLYALKHHNVEKYGHHNKVVLSPIDNTIYIVSTNLKYVYAYNISNKNDVVMLDYEKNAHSINILEYSDDDSSENENEYYAYITYIKKKYRKKKIHKYVCIKLLTVLYLPIPSNCLMITKSNILFFSYNTDEIFISENVKSVLAATSRHNSAAPQRNVIPNVGANDTHNKKLLSNADGADRNNSVNMVVINTHIVSLKGIYFRRKSRGGNRFSRITKEENNKMCSGNQVCADTKHILGLLQRISQKKKVAKKTGRVYYSPKKGWKVRVRVGKFPAVQHVQAYCNHLRRGLFPSRGGYTAIRKRRKKKRRNNNVNRCGDGSASCMKRHPDWRICKPTYLHSVNRENNLYKFIKSKKVGITNKHMRRIAKEGIVKVEFSEHNDYVLLLTREGDFYIFSFFHHFFNVPKSESCYHSGRNVHARFFNGVSMANREGPKMQKTKMQKGSQQTSSPNQCRSAVYNKADVTHNEELTISHNEIQYRHNDVRKRKQKPVIGIYVGSCIIDVSMNIYRKMILVITQDLIIKAYGTYPYVCKHTFQKSIFKIDTFNAWCNSHHYYNFLLWNKQHNFFLISVNQNSYYIFNTNGTLYYSMKQDSSSPHESNENVDYLENNHQDGLPPPGVVCPDGVPPKRSTKHRSTFMSNRLCNRKQNSIKDAHVNISFVFNDFKLFHAFGKDERHHYIKVKNVLYLNDIYSNNKTFHYNSNYYTNEKNQKVYIGLNKIVMFDTNINNFNLSNHEKNVLNIQEIITPFKYVKKCYSNFSNKYMLIISKSICIYSFQKKAFSYFLDDYLKFFFHNYPAGWLFDDIFFVTCLHNKYDENNFRHFKKDDLGTGRGSIFFRRAMTGEGNMSFELFSMDYGTAEVRIAPDGGGEANGEHESDEAEVGEDAEGEEEADGESESFESFESDRSSRSSKSKASAAPSLEDPPRGKDIHEKMEIPKENKDQRAVEESKLLNYLFNINHNESDMYYKYFEEYFNNNKGNIYSKPFSVFYNNFFLKEDENVFSGAYLMEQRRGQDVTLVGENHPHGHVPFEHAEKGSSGEQNLPCAAEPYDDETTDLAHNYYRELQRKLSASTEWSANVDNAEETHDVSDGKKHHSSENQNGESSFSYESSSSLHSNASVPEGGGLRSTLKKTNDKRYSSHYGIPLYDNTHKAKVKINQKKKSEQDYVTKLTRLYEEIISKNNFYYIIYLYNIHNALRFNSYTLSIKLLYRPILTHVYYDKSFPFEEEDGESRGEMNTNSNESTSANMSTINHMSSGRFLIVLDAFYNLLCFKISKVKSKDGDKQEYFLKSENIFILPLNRDNKFIEPRCFYTLFDIFHYVFLNYDNSVYFLHIYVDSNNCYDFEFTRTFNNRVDYIEVVKGHNYLNYYALPGPIKYMWPPPSYYTYLLYYYMVYVLYGINRTCKKQKRGNFTNQIAAKVKRGTVNGEGKINANNKTQNTENAPMIGSLDGSAEPSAGNAIQFEEFEKYQSCERSVEASSFDFFTLSQSEGSKPNEKFQLFESIFKDKLNKHSENYKSLVRLKRKMKCVDLNRWEASKKEALFHLSNSRHLINSASLCDRPVLRGDKANEKYMDRDNHFGKAGKTCKGRSRCNGHSTLLNNFILSVIPHIAHHGNRIANKLNKTVLKYSFYSIIEELENKEKSCYVYLSSNNKMSVISVSKCRDQFCLLNALKNDPLFGSHRYVNCPLVIYRHVGLSRFADDNNSHLHHTVHNMGLCIHIVCSQIWKREKKMTLPIKGETNTSGMAEGQAKLEEIGRNKRNTNNANSSPSPSSYDIISFKINSYINTILFKYFKLYSDAYSYKNGKYQPMYDSKWRKKKLGGIIINIITKYVTWNMFATNILEMVLYKSLNKLNDLYVASYKVIYNYVTRMSNSPYYDRFTRKGRDDTILNISAAVLYSLFLSKRYKERGTMSRLDDALFRRVFGVNHSHLDEEPYLRDYRTGTEGTKRKDGEKENREAVKSNEKVKKKFISFLNEMGANVSPSDASKNDLLKAGVKDERVYCSVLHLLRLTKAADACTAESAGATEVAAHEGSPHILCNNATGGRIPPFDVNTDYAYKINCNVYYAGLYLLCVLRRRQVFHLMLLLKMMRKFCKFHIAEVVINIIRKMDPYVSAILMYALGNYMPHDFMQLCLPNQRYNICSLFIINVQNYLGIYNVRKFYCMYFLCMSLRNNIKYAEDLINFMSILFYTLFETKGTDYPFHCNYFGLDETTKRKIMENALIEMHSTCANHNNFLFLLVCADCFNNIKLGNADGMGLFQFLLGSSNTGDAMLSRTSRASENGSNNQNNHYIHDEEALHTEGRNRLSLKIKTFAFKKFQMNKIVCEFFYNQDMIVFLLNNIDSFSKLHTCNISVLGCAPNQRGLPASTPEDEQSVDLAEVKNIYIRFILLVQNIVCYYIYNMLWFELYYFVTGLKVDVLSFFSHSYFFKSNLFQNVFWGICPVDVSLHRYTDWEFHFVNLENSRTMPHGPESTHMGSPMWEEQTGPVKHTYEDNHRMGKENYGDCKKSKENKGNGPKINPPSGSNKDHREVEHPSGEKLQGDGDGQARVPQNMSSTFKENYQEYTKYINHMKMLGTIFNKLEKENQVINKSFSQHGSQKCFLIDIYKSFKSHFNISFWETKKEHLKRMDTCSVSEEYMRNVSKTEIQNEKNKYCSNLYSYNIYNKLTNYTFLETHLAPSVYKYIPIYNTLKYLYYFFRVCNVKNTEYSKKYLKYKIKKRIYNYICSTIVDLKENAKCDDKNVGQKKKKNNKISFIETCCIHKNDMIWFLLRIFLLLKLPIHALALTLYCKNYVMLNILMSIFPHLYHIVNYILNMNGTHFLYKKKEQSAKRQNGTNVKHESSENVNFILTSEEFNRKLCEYCYEHILHYKRKSITPFSKKMCQKIYGKKISDGEDISSMYDHYMSCECLNNLIFLRKKLSDLRRSI